MPAAEPDPTTGARAVPIYQTTSYDFRDTDARRQPVRAGRDRQRLHPDHEPDAGGARGAASTRSEGGCTTAVGLPGTLAVGSGQAAETLGDPQPRRAPATTSCPRRRSTAAPTTCSTTRCPSSASRSRSSTTPTTSTQWRAAVRHNTKVFFGETIAQPEERRASTSRASSEVAHDARHPADRRQHGADAVPDPPARVGRRHRRALAHQVHRRPRHLDRRRASSTAARSTSAPAAASPASPSPTRATTACAFWPALGPGSYILKARVQLLRDIGAAISPFNAFLILQGLETLSLRMERHFANAQKVAEFLAGPRPGRGRCIYAGLPSSQWHERAHEVRRRQGLRLGARVHDRGRPRGRQAVRRGARAAQPRGQHRRRAQPRDPPGEHDPQPAHRGGAARHRRRSPAWCACPSGWRSIDDILADLDAGFRAAKG